MSIYASLPAPDTEHEDNCGVWDKKGDLWSLSKRPCTCGLLRAPIVYRGSHVLPERDHPRGGSIDLALIPGHVRYWRDNPNAETATEPEGPPEPFLRLGVFGDTRVEGGHTNTVILDRAGAAMLHETLGWWLQEVPA